jgi:hypothetical protein
VGRLPEDLAAPTPRVGTETTLVEPNGTYQFPIKLFLCDEFTTEQWGDQTVVRAMVRLSGLLRLHLLNSAAEQCWLGKWTNDFAVILMQFFCEYAPDECE